MKKKLIVTKTEDGWSHMEPLQEKLRLDRDMEGEIVKVTRVRAKNKRWLTSHRDVYLGHQLGDRRNNYYRVVSSNGVTSVLKSTSVPEIKQEEQDMADLYTKGYRHYDIYDMDYFMMYVMAPLLDEFIKEYKAQEELKERDFPGLPKDEKHDTVVKVAETLRDLLNDEWEGYRNRTEEEEEAHSKLFQEAWGNFGKYFHEFCL